MSLSSCTDNQEKARRTRASSSSQAEGTTLRDTPEQAVDSSRQSALEDADDLDEELMQQAIALSLHSVR